MADFGDNASTECKFTMAIAGLALSISATLLGRHVRPGMVESVFGSFIEEQRKIQDDEVMEALEYSLNLILENIKATQVEAAKVPRGGVSLDDMMSALR